MQLVRLRWPGSSRRNECCWPAGPWQLDCFLDLVSCWFNKYLVGLVVSPVFQVVTSVSSAICNCHPLPAMARAAAVMTNVTGWRQHVPQMLSRFVACPQSSVISVIFWHCAWWQYVTDTSAVSNVLWHCCTSTWFCQKKSTCTENLGNCAKCNFHYNYDLEIWGAVGAFGRRGLCSERLQRRWSVLVFLVFSNFVCYFRSSITSAEIWSNLRTASNSRM